MDENVWMLNINPKGGDPAYNRKKAFEFCFQKKIIGIGWAIKQKLDSHQSDVITKAKDLLAKEYKDKGNYKPAIWFVEDLQINDFVWVYDKTEGAYFLCKVISNWENKTKEDHPWGDHDIVWYRKAEWKKIPRDFIPSKIKINSHRMTLSKCNLDDNTKESIKDLFEKDSKKVIPDINQIKSKIQLIDFKEFLGELYSDEIEDIVCNYIQYKGWRLIKSTASSTLPDFECEFKQISSNNDEINTAYVQVKSYKQKIKDEDLRKYERMINEPTINNNIKVFLFSMTKITSTLPQGVEIITRDELKEYASHHLTELSTLILSKWTRFVEKQQ